MERIVLCGRGIAMTSTVLIMAMVSQAIGTMTSGIISHSNAKAEAATQRSQAELANLEAGVEADRVAKANVKFKARQKMMFIKSGINLSGSPLLILEETQRESEKEVSAIRAKGVAQKALGFAQAQKVESTGRAKLVSGFLKTSKDATMSYVWGKQEGIFE